MEIYSEEKEIISYQEEERRKAGQKESDELKISRKNLKESLEHLERICYAINSYRDMDDNLIGRYGLDSIAEKSRQLAEQIKKDPAAFLEKARKSDYSHNTGNFEGGLSLMSHVQSVEKEKRLQESFMGKVKEYNDFLNKELGFDN